MVKSEPDALELTYPLRTAARLTGLSPELLRAWERRHRVVEPLRTPGGTRRYTAADIERLRLVKAAVDAGHRISQVAQLDTQELKLRAGGAGGALGPETTPIHPLGSLLSALDDMEHSELQRLLSVQLSALGPARFAREVAAPLLYEIGERWVNGQTGIAQEHLATSLLRSMLGSALQPTATSVRGPRIVFGTPSGERHELGLLMAAITALGAGANPLYLGADLPVEDLLAAVEGSEASVVAVSIVTLAPAQAMRALRALRGGLPSDVLLWLGGDGSRDLDLPPGVEEIGSLEALEQRVMLLGLSNGAR